MATSETDDLHSMQGFERDSTEAISNLDTAAQYGPDGICRPYY